MKRLTQHELFFIIKDLQYMKYIKTTHDTLYKLTTVIGGGGGGGGGVFSQ